MAMDEEVHGKMQLCEKVTQKCPSHMILGLSVYLPVFWAANSEGSDSVCPFMFYPQCFCVFVEKNE